MHLQQQQGQPGQLVSSSANVIYSRYVEFTRSTHWLAECLPAMQVVHICELTFTARYFTPRPEAGSTARLSRPRRSA